MRGNETNAKEPLSYDNARGNFVEQAAGRAATSRNLNAQEKTRLKGVGFA